MPSCEAGRYITLPLPRTAALLSEYLFPVPLLVLRSNVRLPLKTQLRHTAQNPAPR